MQEQTTQPSTELVLLLGRLDGKMDTVLSNQGNHDTRLRDLERARWFNLGASGAVAGLVSIAIAIAGVLPR